jgi:type VI secretion system protein ImpE
LEAYINGKYVWVPFSHIKQMKIEPVSDLRDLIWVPAQWQWQNGSEAVGFIPVRYPESELAEDGLLQLSRKTEWQALTETSYQGLGQKVLTTNNDDIALLALEQLVMDDDPGNTEAAGE